MPKKTASDFLTIRKGIITDRSGKPFFLRGINFGGWLMMEGYFMHAPNRGAHFFKDAFKKQHGLKGLAQLEKAFNDNFISVNDFARIACWGVSCIRLPFHYRIVEDKPFSFKAPTVQYLDKAIACARTAGVRIILDLHATPGAQNADWHSDSTGKAFLWKDKHCQERTIELWQFLADRYKDEPMVAGFDLINEPIAPGTMGPINRLYKRIIKAVRQVDKRHIIFLEGHNWAQDMDALIRPDDDLIAYSIHSYQPLEFTFNFIPHLKYPGRINNERWNKARIKRNLVRYKKLSRERHVPIFVGEFGVNTRIDHAGGELAWVDDTLAVFNEFGFHWTYWTYKAIAHSVFPDGIYHYRHNPSWVRREGPLQGWNTWASLWKKYHREMTSSWRTENFTLNKRLLATIQGYC